MVSLTIFFIVAVLVLIPLFSSLDYNNHYHWIWWILLNSIWITLIFTGINIKNNEGQYIGYITSIEQNGFIFKGYNIYLKTDLSSSNEDKACIKKDTNLINELKEAQDNKENVILNYEGVLQYKIGECPDSDWQIIGIKR